MELIGRAKRLWKRPDRYQQPKFEKATAPHAGKKADAQSEKVDSWTGVAEPSGGGGRLAQFRDNLNGHGLPPCDPGGPVGGIDLCRAWRRTPRGCFSAGGLEYQGDFKANATAGR
jgi:hypothetical protein